MQLMESVTSNSHDINDWSLSSPELPLTDLRWGKCVPISDITVIQLRVYTDTEKARIDACEAEYPNISHFPLKGILYGHPYHDGLFPCCVPDAQHLKGHVEKLVLGADRGFPINEGDLSEVKTHLKYLNTKKITQPREQNVRNLWIPKRVIEDRHPEKSLSDTVLEAKLYDSSNAYKDWIAVIRSLKLPWTLLFL